MRCRCSEENLRLKAAYEAKTSALSFEDFTKKHIKYSLSLRLRYEELGAASNVLPLWRFWYPATENKSVSFIVLCVVHEEKMHYSILTEQKCKNKKHS